MLVIGYLFKNSIITPAGGRYQDYIMPGIAAQVGLASIGPTAVGVAMDIRGGLIDRFRSLPISRTIVLLGHTLSDLAVALISLAIVMVVGFAVGWRGLGGLPSVLGGFALIVAFIYAMLWVGALLGLAIKNVEAIDSIGAIVLVLFSFLSNAFIQVQGLPGWVQPIAEWNPLSCVIDACRQLWGSPVTVGSGGFPAAHPALVAIVSLGVIIAVAVPFSLYAYRRAVA
jgi:ABC-2 type transport system permease protein